MSAKIIRYVAIVFLFNVITATFGAEKPLLPIKRWVTATGTPVFYVKEKELPIVDIQVVFDAGSSRDFNKPGLAKITNEALSSGTLRRNANQIAASFDDIGARYSAAVSRDMAAVALRSLSDDKYFNPAYHSFAEVLTQPKFPEGEFSRIKKQTLISLEEQDELPASIATKAFYNALYDDNPYGHPVAGTKASVGKITINDAQSFYKRLYTAQNAMIAIVGNISEDKARSIAEDLTSHLSKGEKPAKLEFKNINEKGVSQHISFPSSQTHVLIGQTGINRNNPDYFPVVVGNYILGGGMLTSRLFDEVREKRGLAYSVGSQFNTFKNKGPFIIELQTRNSEASNAIKVVNETLTNFIKVGPSAAELTAAKKNLTQGFILRLASNSAITAQLVNIGFYQLPLDYLDTYKNNITNVTDQRIKNVFQTLIRPNNLVTVTVGNINTAQHGQTSIH